MDQPPEDDIAILMDLRFTRMTPKHGLMFQLWKNSYKKHPKRIKNAKKVFYLK